MIEHGWILLARHGATSWSSRRYCGTSDPPLGATGRAQATELASQLASWPAAERPTHLISSPRRRALQTAKAIATALGIGVAVDDRWAETDFGAIEGLTFEELEARHPELARRIAEGDVAIDWPGGERHDDLVRRVTNALHAVPDRALVVTHGGPIRVATGEPLEPGGLRRGARRVPVTP